MWLLCPLEVIPSENHTGKIFTVSKMSWWAPWRWEEREREGCFFKSIMKSNFIHYLVLLETMFYWPSHPAYELVDDNLFYLNSFITFIPLNYNGNLKGQFKQIKKHIWRSEDEKANKINDMNCWSLRFLLMSALEAGWLGHSS